MTDASTHVVVISVPRYDNIREGYEAEGITLTAFVHIQNGLDLGRGVVLHGYISFREIQAPGEDESSWHQDETYLYRMGDWWDVPVNESQHRRALEWARELLPSITEELRMKTIDEKHNNNVSENYRRYKDEKERESDRYNRANRLALEWARLK